MANEQGGDKSSDDGAGMEPNAKLGAGEDSRDKSQESLTLNFSGTLKLGRESSWVKWAVAIGTVLAAGSALLGLVSRLLELHN